LSLATDADIYRIVSPEDLTKASKYVRMDDRDRFLAARILTWHVLSGSWTSDSSSTLVIGEVLATKSQISRKLDCNLSGDLYPLRYEYSRNGKPNLPSCSVSFNWSHSGDLVALVLGLDHVGVDVEEIETRALFDYKSLCTERELEWISASVDQLRYSEKEAFIVLWTAKEAVLKAFGSGLSVDPREVEIRFVQDETGGWESDFGNKKFFGTRRILVVNSKKYALSWCGRMEPSILEVDKCISLSQK
jgi:phosphopantetheinyl transferase